MEPSENLESHTAHAANRQRMLKKAERSGGFGKGIASYEERACTAMIGHVASPGKIGWGT